MNQHVVVNGTETGLDPNRAPTRADAVALGEVYRRLTEAEKGLRTATADLNRALAVYSKDGNYGPLLEAVSAAAEWYASEKLECRKIIDALPNGTTGPGGKATRQTVVLQFYGQVNRNLNHRLTAAEAKRINAAAFGG